MAVNLLDFDLDGLAAYCDSLGEKRFRATQLFRWIHQRGASDFAQMSDLAKSLRDKLAHVAEVRALPIISEQAEACSLRPAHCRSSASRPRPTARSSGCSTSAAATPSRRCSFR